MAYIKAKSKAYEIVANISLILAGAIGGGREEIRRIVL